MPSSRVALALLAAPLAVNASGLFPGLLAADPLEAEAAEASLRVTLGSADHGSHATTLLLAVSAVVMLIVLGFARQPVAITDDKAENEASAASAALVAITDGEAAPSEIQDQPGWGTVVLCFCCCSLAAGIVPGQTIFVKLFVHAGAFKSLCSGGFQGPVCDEQFFRMAELLNTVSLAVMVPCIAFGVAFDRWGGRTCGIIGSVWVAVAFIAIAVIVSLISAFPDANMELSYTLVFAILIADIGGFLCDYAVLGYLWHFPEHQTVIFALWNVTYNSGAFFALGLEGVMVWFGVPFVYPLVWWAIAQGAVTYVLYRIVPSHSEFHAKAKDVLGVKLPEAPTSFELMPSLSAAWRVLMQDAGKHFSMGLLVMAGTAYGMYYLSMAVPIGNALFGSDAAGERLGTYCTISVGVVGCLAGLLVSIFADSYGFGVLVVTYVLSLLAFTATFWIPSWGAATVACSTNAAFSMLIWVMSSRWFVNFAAPSRLGTVIGVFYFFTYTASIVETWATLEWSESIEPGLKRFLLPLGVSGALAVLTAFLFSLQFWLWPPFPEMPRLVAEDERDLAEPWGCSSFEEVGRLLGIEDRAEVIRRLCSTDPAEIAALLAMLGEGNGCSPLARD